MSVVTSNSRTSDQHGQSCMPCLSERYKSERRAFLVSKVTQNLQQCLQVHAVECFLAVPEVDIDLSVASKAACLFRSFESTAFLIFSRRILLRTSLVRHRQEHHSPVLNAVPQISFLWQLNKDAFFLLFNNVS